MSLADGNKVDDVVTGGSGEDLLFGGVGADAFVVTRDTEDLRIRDFRAAEGDSLRLDALGFSSESQALGFATEISAGVTFDFAGGQTVFLRGATIADISDAILV